MTFPTDPLFARLTLQALSYPICTVRRVDLLALVERAGLGKASPIWTQVAAHDGQHMQVQTAVVRELLGRGGGG